MASNLFNSMGKGGQMGQNGGNPMNILQKVGEIQKMLNGQNPQDYINNMLKSGQISEAQVKNAMAQAQQIAQMFGIK